MFESVLARLQQVVRTHPNAVAIEGSTTITYSVLWQRAAALGRRLSARGAGPETIVGIDLGASAGHVEALLGCWFARAAFLPIDASLSNDARRRMLDEANVAIVIDQAMLLGDGPAHDASNIDDDDPPATDANDLAYCIYTSGSTGAPKGVLVPHRGIVGLLDAQIDAFRLAPGDRALLYLCTAFDASISDIGTALLSGATLHIPKQRPTAATLVDFLGAQRITHADLPPGLLSRIDVESLPDSLRTVVIGGEPCPVEVVRAWAQRVRLVNVYGPTEATICASMCVCDPEHWDRALLGQPIPNVRFAVLDAHLAPVADGTPAELYIAGPGLARGYLNRAALTDQSFITRGDERLYRTGDRVVRDAHGEFEFLGRTDRQVKVRGLRIEPEAIERRLVEHHDITSAHVHKHRSGSLVAWCEAPHTPPTPISLRAHLIAVVPGWMIPQRFVILPELPRTPSGKVDPTRLVEPGRSQPTSVAGRTADERALVSIWRATLANPDVGIHDDFFEMGGDSLMALDIAASASQLDLSIAPADLLLHPTIASILGRVRDKGPVPETHETPDNLTATAAPACILQTHSDRYADLARATPPAPDGAPNRILITGATGFVGAHLLSSIQARGDVEVVCLVRAPSAEAARARIRASAERRGLNVDRAPFEVVCGDVELPRMGLPFKAWSDLSGSVDAIVHLAAMVNLVRPYTALSACNVGGAAEALRLTAHGRPKHLHYASTLSVFVGTDRNRGHLSEHDDLAATQTVFGGYAQTKWTAERLLRPAARATSFHRLGLITGSTRDGRGPADDLLSLFLRDIARLGFAPDAPHLALDLTPVDYAADALAHIVLSGERPATYHIANPVSASLPQLIEALRIEGVPVRDVSVDEFVRQRSGARHTAAYLALCRCLAPSTYARHRAFDLFQATDVSFGDRATAAALKGSGVSCPAPDDALLSAYVRAALDA